MRKNRKAAPQDELEDHVVAELEASLTYWKCKRAVKEELVKKPKYDTEDMSATIPLIMEELGLATQMRNMIYNMYRNAIVNPPPKRELSAPPLPVVEEPLEAVNKARMQWESGIAQELHAIAAEQGTPLCRLLSPMQKGKSSDNKEGLEDLLVSAVDQPPTSDLRVLDATSDAEGTGEGGANGAGADAAASSAAASAPEEGGVANAGSTGRAGRPPPRFMFDSDDILEAIKRIGSPNHSSNITGIAQWGLVQVQLKTPSIGELKKMFSDLHPYRGQIGLDDVLAEEVSERFCEERFRLGTKAASDGYIPVARQFAKRGVPAALRPMLWCRVLELQLGSKDLNQFERMTQESRRWTMVTDELFQLDARRVADDDSFFVFEEILMQVVSVFVCDEWVRANCAYQVHDLVIDPTHNVCVPPCGVQPFLGFVSYIAPLCYLFQRPEPLYFIFRTMWCRYWCKLNCLRSKGDTLVPLCRLFEDLLQSQEPAVFYHLLEIDVQPLKIALPWIQLGFTGYFEVEQVLLLWDRILGFDTLTILPVVAAAIFVFRSRSLLAAADAQEVEEIMMGPCRLQVVPLLQHFLFSDEVK